MSESDSFIEEVTEEVRRDQLFALFRKYGWIAILGVLLIVGTAAWHEWNKAKAEKAARDFGDAVSTAQAQNDPAAGLKALQALTATGMRKDLLNFLIASLAVKAHDTKAALAALDQVTTDKTAPQTMRDLAELKRVIIAGSTMPEADRKAALDQLAQAGRPYRPLALEQLALMQAAHGDKAGAVKAFKALLQEPNLTPRLRQRAVEMIVALGGNPAAK